MTGGVEVVVFSSLRRYFGHVFFFLTTKCHCTAYVVACLSLFRHSQGGEGEEGREGVPFFDLNPRVDGVMDVTRVTTVNGVFVFVLNFFFFCFT